MEAMAAGCAIVCTDVGGIPQLIENGDQGLLVTPGSEEELAAALANVTEDDAVRRRVAAAGHARIQSFDTSCKVREILSIYHRVLGRSQPLSAESR
jgi:glycosyltransferase involved in cell wall biosynthesis